MNILLMGEFLPIAGEISDTAYWMVKNLLDDGNKVFVVTNGWATSSDYRIDLKSNEINYLNSEGLKIVSIDPLQQRLSNYDYKSSVARLITLAMEIDDKYGCDVIWANSIEPYWSAATFLKKILNKPLVLSHFDVDLSWKLYDPELEKVNRYIIKNADAILAQRSQIIKYKYFDSSVELTEYVNYYPNNLEYKRIESFGFSSDIPNVLLLGHAKYPQEFRFWLKQLEDVSEDYNLVVCCYGVSVNELKEIFQSSQKLEDKISFIHPKSPWNEIKLIGRSEIIITTTMFRENKITDTYLYKLMATGKMPFINDVMRNNYSELLDKDNFIMTKKLSDFIEYMVLNIDNLNLISQRNKSVYEDISKRSITEILEDVI